MRVFIGVIFGLFIFIAVGVFGAYIIDSFEQRQEGFDSRLALEDLAAYTKEAAPLVDLYLENGDYKEAERALELLDTALELAPVSFYYANQNFDRQKTQAFIADLENARREISELVPLYENIQRSEAKSYLDIFRNRLSLITGAALKSSNIAALSVINDIWEPLSDLSATVAFIAKEHPGHWLEWHPEAQLRALDGLLERLGKALQGAESKSYSQMKSAYAQLRDEMERLLKLRTEVVNYLSSILQRAEALSASVNDFQKNYPAEKMPPAFGRKSIKDTFVMAVAFAAMLYLLTISLTLRGAVQLSNGEESEVTGKRPSPPGYPPDPAQGGAKRLDPSQVRRTVVK